jgi:3-oxoacyl-[acyl-carrier-protein] synthase II
MKGMQITGLGLVGGFGCGKADLLVALDKGAAPLTQVELRGHQFPLFKADSTPLEGYLNKRALRRIDHFSRMALLGAFQAFDDAGQPNLDRSRLGIVICSGFGALSTTFKFLDSVLENGDVFASPTAFSNSVHNAAAAHISMQMKITGPSLTVSQFDQSLVSGLLSAQQWLDEGRVDAVLLGAVDEYCSVLGYCWERFLGGCGWSRMRPLNFSETTAIAGEGAAFFLLQPESSGQSSYGLIEQVETGNLCGSRPQLPTAQPLLLNCDGFPATGEVYRQQLVGIQPVGCYTPLYGVSPVSQAFDLAVGSLALQRDALFPSVDTGGDYFDDAVIEAGQPCAALSCLRYGMVGDYAAIHLSKGVN